MKEGHLLLLWTNDVIVGALALSQDPKVMECILGLVELWAGQILCLDDLGEQANACSHCPPLDCFYRQDT